MLVVLHVTGAGRGEGVRVVTVVMRVVVMVEALVVVVLAVSQPVRVGRSQGGAGEGRGGAGVPYDGLLQLLGHGDIADLSWDDLIKHLDARRQHEVRLAVLACVCRVQKRWICKNKHTAPASMQSKLN